MGGNHKRWLEEEWRDDLHFGGLNREDLHKRWFGQDIIAWLEGLLNGGISVNVRHDYEEEISAILLQEEWNCDINENTKFFGKVDAVATASVKMSTSFGFTLITTLKFPLDLSQSFLHFDNEGDISAVFTLEALAKLDFDSKVFNLAKIPLPGAGFIIHGIMEIGPSFHLDARVKAGIAISGSVEARVEIASWQIRQTYPEENDNYKPKSIDDPQRNMDVKGLKQPEFDVSVQALGYLEAHLLPTLAFGIDVDPFWKVGKATVELVADGWVRLRAKSDLIGGDCAFGYAVDAGASLIAQATVPDAFSWKPQPLPIGDIERTLIPDNGDEWKCLTGGAAGNRRTIDNIHGELGPLDGYPATTNASSSTRLKKRLVPYGPIFSIPDTLCPTQGPSPNVGTCDQIFAVDGLDDSPDLVFKRDIPLDQFNNSDSALALRSDGDLHWLESRLNKKSVTACEGNGAMTIPFPNYSEATVIYDNQDWADCNNYNFGIQPALQSVPRPPGAKTPTERYITEHVLEAQMMKLFMDKNYRHPGDANSICNQMAREGWNRGNVVINGVAQNPWRFVTLGYPGDHANSGDFMRIIETVNLIKERVSHSDTISISQLTGTHFSPGREPLSLLIVR